MKYAAMILCLLLVGCANDDGTLKFTTKSADTRDYEAMWTDTLHVSHYDHVVLYLSETVGDTVMTEERISWGELIPSRPTVPLRSITFLCVDCKELFTIPHPPYRLARRMPEEHRP